MRLKRLELGNFLSYRNATIEFGDLTALVGPNASGKSNAVAALKLLRDIPEYGLQTAVIRRGGFDQLRHRSEGRPFDPSVAIEFAIGPDLPTSRYELHFGSVAGGRYVVKLEKLEIHQGRGESFELRHTRGRVVVTTHNAEGETVTSESEVKIPEGQSAIGAAISFSGAFPLWQLFGSLNTVEINPARVRELQDPTPGFEMEPDGSNLASVYDRMSPGIRAELIDELSAVVPGLNSIEVRRLSNKMTLNFLQTAGDRSREFLASQISDGTLRAFGIILALVAPMQRTLIVVEEPEVAIHLGALRTLVEILREHAQSVQIVMTTHSADIIDALGIDELRVVWAEDGQSHVAPVSAHTREVVRSGLITPGELLRADSLDPAPA